ncbi:centaurin/arf [Anaeramoeba flamelloides]|uniref:Centaurin/arf n=1 Tax=Anaeramoeba flamelloides TaxID=1746091 RepID=A0ABQ8Z2Y4_9EUKA|nr:centaurin/arf [Anaeramoeba flamelloides]
MDLPLKEILNNSPMFHSQLQAYEKKNECLKLYIKSLNKVALQYVKAAENMADVGDRFADQILGYKELLENNTTEQIELEVGKELMRFGKILKEVNKNRRMNFRLIQTLLVDPMEDFLKVDLKEAKQSRSKLEKLKSDFNSAQTKYLNTAPQKKKSEKIQQIFKTAEETYILGCHELVSKLHTVNEKNKFEFMERMFALLFSQISYYHHSHEIMLLVKPGIQRATNTLEEIKKRFTKFQDDEKLNQQDLLKMLYEKRIQKEKNKKLLEKVGYLHMKTGSMVKDWKKRYFIVENHKIYYVKNSKDLTPRGNMDLLLCSVKMNYDLKRRNCFEIHNPMSENKLLLQAPNEEEVRSWIEVINNNVGELLNKQQSPTQDIHIQEEIDKILKKFHSIPGCDVCTDCNTPEPDWCSLNLGVTFCIDCSGAHRSLGTQISKVRSLTLDEISDNTYNLFSKLGNKIANSILEKTLDQDTKPKSTDSVHKKKEFIIKKYKNREFVGETPDLITLNKLLWNSCKNKDLGKAYFCLVNGANANWTYLEENNESSVHSAAFSGDLQIIKLLHLFNADINLLNLSFETPLHYAIRYNYIDIVSFLLEKNAIVFFKQNISQDFSNAYEISLSLNKTECIKLIEKYSDQKEIENFKKDNPELMKLKNTFVFKSLVKKNTPLIFKGETNQMKKVENTNRITIKKEMVTKRENNKNKIESGGRKEQELEKNTKNSNDKLKLPNDESQNRKTISPLFEKWKKMESNTNNNNNNNNNNNYYHNRRSAIISGTKKPQLKYIFQEKANQTITNKNNINTNTNTNTNLSDNYQNKKQINNNNNFGNDKRRGRGRGIGRRRGRGTSRGVGRGMGRGRGRGRARGRSRGRGRGRGRGTGSGENKVNDLSFLNTNNNKIENEKKDKTISLSEQVKNNILQSIFQSPKKEKENENY